MNHESHFFLQSSCSANIDKNVHVSKIEMRMFHAVLHFYRLKIRYYRSNLVQVSARKKKKYWGDCPLHRVKAYQDKENVTLRQKSRTMHQIAWQMIMELRASKSKTKMRKSDIKRTVWLMNVCRAAELAVYYVCLIRSSKLVLGEL